MNFLSLFAGIGGLDLGLERAGWTCIGQVEIDPFCRGVLAKHWPEVARHDDVHTAVAWWRSEPRPIVDLVCGGFPCQPVSTAGKRLAQADERWLWPAAWAVIRDLRPRWVVLENVPGLLSRGMGDVLGDLAEGGYDAQWDCVPAAAVGAPHRRDRVFVVAYPSGEPRRGGMALAGDDVADADRLRCYWRSRQGCDLRGWPEPSHSDWWTTEPDVGRVAYGIPSRVERLRALGNAVVPQVAEHIGRMILQSRL
jgi:DNA (cytosine-5)-methyltransferase 1